MLRGVFIKAKNNFPFLVVSITILTLLTLNFILPIQKQNLKAATPAEITKTSTADWNEGELTSLDATSNELKITKTADWVDENYLYREQLTVSAKAENAIPKGFTLNSTTVSSGTFDGSGDWFDVGTNFNESLPVTIEAWVNLKSWNSHIFSSRETVTSNYNGFWMYVDSAGKVFLSYGDNTGQVSQARRSKYGDTVIALDTWTHITGVIRGATDMSIYINGVDANGTYSGSGGTMVNSATSSARIGWRNVAVNPMMKGNIDELRIWSKARSQAEILADMNKEIVAQTNLDAYYKFNQTTGSLIDDSGNSNTGTAGGNANYAPYSNVWGGINTKALIDTGKMRSDGNDLRVFYNSLEIERELIPATDKTLSTSEATQVLFKSQAVVASAQTDNNYYIYYGDSDAIDPVVNVYNKMTRTRNAYIAPYSGNGANYLQYNADNFPTNGDGTIELWFKYSNSEQHNYTTPLLSGEDTNNTWSWWYGRSGYRVIGRIGGNDIALVGTGHNDGGEWNNLVITWHNTDLGSEIKTYENNVLTANKTDGTTITSWPSYIKLTDSLSTYDGIEIGKIGIYNTVKDATWVSTGYTSNAVAPIADGQRDSSAKLLHNFDGDGFDATSVNGGYASGTATATTQGLVMSGDYRMGDTFDERAGSTWVSGIYNWYDNFDSINIKSPGWTEYGDINNVSNELRLANNGQQLLMNRLSTNTPTNYQIDVSAKGTQPEILFNHQSKTGWWGNNICSTNIAGAGDALSDLGQPKDAATNFLTGATSKYYLGLYNGYSPKYIQFDLGTNGNYGGVVWEYWNGSAWTAFTPTTDGTSNFSKSGIVDISNISASYGANPAADGACGFNGNFNVIRISAGTVTTAATIKQINRTNDFANVSYSATTNAIAGDSHNASGTTTISRSTSAYKQIGLRRVGTGLQSFYDNYQSINTTTNSSFDTNLLGLSATTDATFDNFKMYKALADEPLATILTEETKYPISEATDWYDATWSNRQKITIDHTKVTNSDQNNFPVLINISDQSNQIFTKAQADGDDILFTSSDGKSKLSHEIETFSQNGVHSLVAWIKVPILSYTADTVLYLYYGNASAASQQNKTDVWSNGYVGVWHMNETSGLPQDSTSYNNDVASNDGATYTYGVNSPVHTTIQSAGRTGRQSFSIAKNTQLDNMRDNISLSGWFKFNTGQSRIGPIALGGSGEARFALGVFNGSVCYFSNNDWGPSFNDAGVVADVWNYFTLTYASGTVKYYRNGALKQTWTGVPALSLNTVFAGASIGTGDIAADGQLSDEPAISSEVRTPDWIATEYANQNDSASFYSISQEQFVVQYASPTSVTSGSGILDTGWIGDWGTPNGFRANVTVPTNTSIQFQIRSSAIGGANNNDWTAWADVGTATTSGSYDILTASMPNITLGLNRYLQLKVGLVSTDGSSTPVLNDYTVYYSSDGDAPTNPTISTVNVGGSSVSDGSWINFNGATNFNFSGSTDSESGVAGYYTYFGTDANGTPATYQAHSGAIGDIQTYSTVIASSDDGKHYHFKIKTVDIAGNSSEAVELYDFGYDNTAPLRPAFVSANPSGYTTQNSYAFTWPASTDPVGAGGSASGVKWYEYKTFADAAWSHTANASVTTVSGIQAYQQGVNGFYVRTVDLVGNTSDDQQVTYYSSGDAPAKPTNLTIDPTTSDQNLFTISWDRPSVSQDKPAIKGYWYSVNAAPTVNNVTFVSTTEEHVELAELPFATIQGENTFYVLSEDQSGNKSYETNFVASQTFNCQTSALPTPTAISIYDSSDRAINRWMLTTQWLAGPNQDPGTFDHYLIERSTDGVNYSFLATTTSNAYIDSENLDNNILYYYRVKSVDNAAKESVASTVVSKQPTGRYLVPPSYEGSPTTTVKSASATITWYTDRDSSSFVKYGLDRDFLLESKGQFDKVKKHYVEITGLTAGKTYYFKVQSVDEDREYVLDEAYSELYTLTTLNAPAISNVNVNNISLASAEISFETTTVSNSVIKYGLDANYTNEIEDNSGQGTTTHKILLSSLISGTRYHFKIFGLDIDGNILTSDDYSFETLPMPIVSNLKVSPIADASSFSVNVSWETNVETTTLLNYSKAGEASKEKVAAKLEKSHTIEVSGLVDQATYTLEATGRDQFGNLAKSLSNTLPTPKDSRPPKFSNLQLESKVVGSGKDAKAQLIVSWKSDELATSQVEYSVGSGSDQYDSKTTEDSFLTTDHLVIISNLEVSRAYHLRAISKDESLNSGVSEDSVIITKKAVQDAFSLIVDTLSQSLGFLGKLLKFGL